MQIFFAEYLNNLQELHDDISNIVRELPAEALDWSPKEGVNPITVLVVHLTGSQRFLFGEVIGGQDVHRDRDAEFRAKGLASDELVKRLRDSIAAITDVLERLTVANLDTKCMFRTREVTVGWALGHALKHTATHLGHIHMMRDMWYHLKG
jgi:uncharacterized damage-inducible protein DinB